MAKQDQFLWQMGKDQEEVTFSFINGTWLKLQALIQQMKES